jgi:hypothetical protein
MNSLTCVRDISLAVVREDEVLFVVLSGVWEQDWWCGRVAGVPVALKYFESIVIDSGLHFFVRYCERVDMVGT